MVLLDKYLVARFSISWLKCAVAVVLFMVFCKLAGQADKVAEAESPVRYSLGYLLGHIPVVLVAAYPFIGLMATYFSVSGMARTNELAAMMAAGVSPQRIAIPMVLVAAVWSLLGVLVNVSSPMGGWVQRVLHVVWSPCLPDREHVVLRGEGGKVLYSRRVTEDGRVLHGIVLAEHDASGGLAQILDAEIARWHDVGSGSGYWELLFGTIRRFDRVPGAIEIPFVMADPFCIWQSSGILLAEGERGGSDAVPPGSADWLVAWSGEVTCLRETPLDILYGDVPCEEMGYGQLSMRIERAKRSGGGYGRELAELYFRTSFPLGTAFLVLVAIPFAARGGARSMIGAGVHISLGALFYALAAVGKACGTWLVPPILGAWLADGVFLAAGIGVWSRVESWTLQTHGG